MIRTLQTDLIKITQKTLTQEKTPDFSSALPFGPANWIVLQNKVCSSWASPVAQLVKNLHAMQETWVQSLGWEDPLEKGKATHSSILAWRIPRTITETMGLQTVGHNWAIFTFHSSWKKLNFSNEQPRN